MLEGLNDKVFINLQSKKFNSFMYFRAHRNDLENCIPFMVSDTTDKLNLNFS